MREIETLDGRKAFVTDSIVTFFPNDNRLKLGKLDLQHIFEAMLAEEKITERKSH